MPPRRTPAAELARKHDLATAIEHLRLAQRLLRQAGEPILSMRTGSLAEATDLVVAVPNFSRSNDA